MYEEVDPEVVVYEGELKKYNPGFKFQYVQRYCTLTKYCFCYFKNEYNATKNQNPLVTIKLDDIDMVQRTTVPLPTSTPQEDVYNHFQFEIYLKEEECETNLQLPANHI